MRKFIYVILACFLWAIQNAALEIKLGKYSPLANMLITYVTALPLGLITLLFIRKSVTFPVGGDLGWAVGCAVVFFIADFFFISAYALGGNSTSITVLALSIPVFVVGIKFFWIGEVPTTNHLLAFVFAGCALFFVYRAESEKPKSAEVTQGVSKP